MQRLGTFFSLFTRDLPVIIMISATIATGGIAGFKIADTIRSAPPGIDQNRAAVKNVSGVQEDTLTPDTSSTDNIRLALIDPLSPTTNPFSNTSSSTSSSCIVTLFGKRYNVSRLKATHSGGDIFQCGTDMSNSYSQQHGSNVSRMAAYLITASGNTTAGSGGNTGGGTAPAPIIIPGMIFNTASLALHNKTGDCYVAYAGKVYNLSNNSVWGGCSHKGVVSGGIDITSLFPHPASYLSGIQIMGTFSNSSGGGGGGTTPAPTPAPLPGGRYTAATLALHNKAGDCYVAYAGKVYDLSNNSVWGGCSHKGVVSGGIDITSVFPHPARYLSGIPVVGTYSAGSGGGGGGVTPTPLPTGIITPTPPEQDD
jgi:predicted heme/steroid binding protein